MEWKFDKTVNMGHVLILVSGMSAGIGMYYSTQAKIADSTAVSTAKNQLQDQTIGVISNNQVKILAALERLDREQGAQNTAIEILKDRVKDGS